MNVLKPYWNDIANLIQSLIGLGTEIKLKYLRNKLNFKFKQTDVKITTKKSLLLNKNFRNYLHIFPISYIF